jgi:hypothetical protein
VLPPKSGAQADKGGRTAQLLFPSSFAAEGRQAADKLLEVDRSSSAARREGQSTSWRVSDSRAEGRAEGRPELSSAGPDAIRKTYSSSKIAIIRLASGLLAIWGMSRNSSLSIVPEPSRSSFMKRFLSRWSSAAETAVTEGGRVCESAGGDGGSEGNTQEREEVAAGRMTREAAEPARSRRSDKRRRRQARSSVDGQDGTRQGCPSSGRTVRRPLHLCDTSEDTVSSLDSKEGGY